MKHLMVVMFLVGTFAGSSQSKDLSLDSTNVSIPFFSGLNNYKSFRIPTLIKARKTLMAFAEGRKNSSSDFGDIDVTYRRSQDDGKTWEPLQILYDNDSLVAQNPVPVFDEKLNRIVLLFNTSSLSEHDILNKDYPWEKGRRVFVTFSDDEGKTWEKPFEITKDVKRDPWRWHALGPVHGIQLQNKKNKGRLIVPVSISLEKGNKAYAMALIYSDDHGLHWKIGAVDHHLSDTVQSNETTVVELNDGSIYVNTRDQNGGSLKKNRGETYSLDGGLSFDGPITESAKFPSPIVEASLLRWSHNTLFFSTPSNPNKRENLILMASHDESKTWQSVFKIHTGFSAYSDMVKLDKNTLGILYETDGYKKIRFRRVSIKK